MFCQQCGDVVPEGQTFCDDCSRKIFQQDQVAPGDACAGGPQPPGPAPSEHVGQYLEAHSTGVQYGVAPQTYQRVAQRRGNPTLATALTWAALGSGLIVILTTFLTWTNDLDSPIGVRPTGWTWLAQGRTLPGGNFIWVKSGDLFYFTGLWPILVGIGIVAGAILMLLGWRQGRWLAGGAGVAGLGVATVNMIMTWKLNFSMGPGVWLMLLFSVIAVLAAEFAERSSP